MKNRASALFVDSIYDIYLYFYIYYNGCKGIYIEKFFQPSYLRNLMVGGLQGEEWKFIQKYLKKRSKRVGALISQFVCRFRTLHGDLRKSRQLISQLGIHFRRLSSKFASCKITFASWVLISHVGVPNSQDANLSFSWMQLSCEGHIFLI